MPKIRLSVDDGCSSDKRLAELALKYKIQCTFYWPVEWHSLAYEKGYEPLSYKDAQWIANRFNIGSHTITHRYLTKISEDDAKLEIEESRSMLQDMFMVKIEDFAPPRGYTNESLTRFTNLFYKRQRLTKGEKLVHIHPDSGANDNKPWRNCVNEKTEELWCHSYDLNKYNLWDELESWLKSIS